MNYIPPMPTTDPPPPPLLPTGPPPKPMMPIPPRPARLARPAADSENKSLFSPMISYDQMTQAQQEAQARFQNRPEAQRESIRRDMFRSRQPAFGRGAEDMLKPCLICLIIVIIIILIIYLVYTYCIEAPVRWGY